MRKQTLLNHLRETKSAIRTERPRIKNQEKFIREMKADGHDTRAMNDLLRTMKANLIELQRHGEVLSVQLERTNRSSGRNPASEHARKLGLEGIFSKRLSSTYRPGKTKAWLKLKNPPGYLRHAQS